MIRWLWRWRTVKWLGALCAAVLLAGGWFAWHKAGELVRPATRAVGPPPADFPCEEVIVESESPARLAGWFHRGKQGRGVVVVLHGIRSSRKASLPRARLLAEAGFSTLMVDLRCHGESVGGEFITLGHLERLDVAAAVRDARRQCPGEPVGVVGFSLGGAAIALADSLEVDAVVLEAVYPTIDAAVDNRTARLGSLSPVASWCLLAQLEPRTGVRLADLRPVDRVKEIGCPVLIVGGGKDKHTTPADTRRLFAAAAEPKELVWFDDWAHNNYARWEPDQYRATVVDFLSRWLKTNQPAGANEKPPGDR